VHPPENQQNHTELGAFQFGRVAKRAESSLGLGSWGDVANIDEVEDDDEHTVDVIGRILITVEDIKQEDASTVVERTSDPDGESDPDDEIDELAGGHRHG
jgi:hypothetical protein